MLTVIMPLFNAEKYLKEALQSIQKQTYKDFELICINDASTDTTMEILKRFKDSDSRIRILENDERSGAAFSRNRGVQEAQGEYITFLDGDDIFEEEMLEAAYITAKDQAADIVIYEYKHVSSEQIYEKKVIQRSMRFVERYCRTAFSLRNCEPIELMSWNAAPWNKLFKKKFIIDNQLEFQNLSSSNDVYFVLLALFLAEKIIWLDDRRVMIYARDHNVPTRVSYSRNPMCVYQALEKLGQELVARDLFEEMFQYYYSLFFIYFKNALLKAKREEDAKAFYKFLQIEGINNLIALNSDCYQNIDDYLYSLLDNFRKLDYSSGWYKNENSLSFYLECNVQKLTSLFRSYKTKNIRTALWGVGTNGRAFLYFLKKYGLKVTEVTDCDVSKHGKIIDGYEVKDPKEVLENVQVIIACNYEVYVHILQQLNGRKIEVVDLETVVGKY